MSAVNFLFGYKNEDNPIIDPYKKCPKYENENCILRMISKEDKEDLLKVYSERKTEWNKRLNIGLESITDRALFVGLSYQKQLMKQSELLKFFNQKEDDYFNSLK